MANGSVIYRYSAESPERQRGPNLSGVWCDELAAWRFASEAWEETLLPAVRIGDPHIVITTTPKATSSLRRELLERDDGSVAATRGTTFDNADNLSAKALAEYRRFEDTRIGRQELLGELLDDVEGALWTRDLIEPYRVRSVDRSALARVVVGVDPAMTAHERSDETGIVVAGVDRAGQGYVLEDATCRLSPNQWARRVASVYHRWQADRIVAEVTGGYELVVEVLRAVDEALPITKVHARHGKSARAEPIAARYEHGNVHHVGAFPTCHRAGQAPAS